MGERTETVVTTTGDGVALTEEQAAQFCFELILNAGDAGITGPEIRKAFDEVHLIAMNGALLENWRRGDLTAAWSSQDQELRWKITDEGKQPADSTKLADAKDKVIVVDVEWYGVHPGDYAGWTSVHRTEAGAQKRLEARAKEMGLDLAAIDDGTDTSGSTYSKSYLTLED